MGNPAWGHGFHKGVGKGRIQGVVFSVVVSALAGGVAVGRKWIVERRTQPSGPPRDTHTGPAGGARENRDDKPDGGGESSDV